MIKRISLVRRAHGMSSEEFVRYWLGPHTELALRLPRLRGYRVNVIRDELPGGWDGIAEVWFDSEDDLRAAFASLAEELAIDRPKFISEVYASVVEEHVVLSGPPVT